LKRANTERSELSEAMENSAILVSMASRFSCGYCRSPCPHHPQ
jgi:heterodisulfide reductase subunit C